MQAQGQRTSIRDEEVSEEAFQAKHKGKQPAKDSKKPGSDKRGKGKGNMGSKGFGKKDKFSTVQHLSKDQSFGEGLLVQRKTSVRI